MAGGCHCTMMLVELVLYAVTFVGGTRIAYQKNKCKCEAFVSVGSQFQKNKKK